MLTTESDVYQNWLISSSVEIFNFDNTVIICMALNI